MKNFTVATGLLLGLCMLCSGGTTVLWQDGFPTVESQPVSQAVLKEALSEKSTDLQFATVEELGRGVRRETDLLVLPYGSAFPVEAWAAIEDYLQRGGALLVIGGQPFRVPVMTATGQPVLQDPQDRFARKLGIRHSYEAPDQNADHFAWKHGYDFLPALEISSQHNYVLEGHLNGLGYLLNGRGDPVSAPIVVADSGRQRSVYLDFDPAAGYWNSANGKTLIRTAAEYARQPGSSLSLDVLFSTIRPDEKPVVTLRLRRQARGTEEMARDEVVVDLLLGEKRVASQRFVPQGEIFAAGLNLPATLKRGFYTIRATYRSAGKPHEVYENGLWVAESGELETGPLLGANADFLTLGGKPFLPVGTNYFSTESNGWDFSGPRNAAIWERDFAAMEKQSVTFVRTGVWGGQLKVLEGRDEGVTERFLRNVEAYLLCAHQHHIAVNFTFFAFDPQTTWKAGGANPAASLPGSNPYLDPTTVQAEQSYLLSIVNRFKNVPSLSWDLINEPSFSNPRALWHGNTPNNDPAELHAWHEWLRARYKTSEAIARAWSVTPDGVSSFDAIPLPDQTGLNADVENGGEQMVRAYDYNRFAQDAFAGWVQTMVNAIRASGSKQIIDVGQDEGGVESRVLNQFYGHAGVSFTTNHTYRQNQNLLWDSWASKVPGVPNIVGETGYQPVTYPNGDWHFDEVTGLRLIESKWAAGFAAGTSGFLSWDWDREVYFGLLRSDGSEKTWIDVTRQMGDFAKRAAPFATSVILPDTAIVLPQSLQLSVFSPLSVEAQQASVRALYGYTRLAAYAVGEDQIDRLGNPKLIIVPSPWVLSDACWTALLEAARQGATVLISGRFDLNEHFEPTSRAKDIGIAYNPKLLDTLRNAFTSPAGSAVLNFGGKKTDLLQAAALPGGATFVEKPMGSGKLLFATLPLELSDNTAAVGDVYRYASQEAGITPVYTTKVQDAAILICPTVLPKATLYVVSSQTSREGFAVAFHDVRSGKDFASHLDAGRSALLLIGTDGTLISSYNWP